MSAVPLGKNTRLLLGRTAGSQVEFTGMLDGTDAIQNAATRNTRPIPGGRGVAAAQLVSFGQASLTLGCDSNSVHDAVLLNGNIQRMFFTLQFEGEGQGAVQVTGQAVARTSLQAALPQDAFRWQVALEVDGDVDATPQT